MARSFTPIPNEYLEEMEKLTDEQFGRLMRACVAYNTTGDFPRLNDPEDFYRLRCKNRLDRYKAEYEQRMAQRSEAGRKAAEARWHPDNPYLRDEDAAL